MSISKNCLKLAIQMFSSCFVPEMVMIFILLWDLPLHPTHTFIQDTCTYVRAYIKTYRHTDRHSWHSIFTFINFYPHYTYHTYSYTSNICIFRIYFAFGVELFLQHFTGPQKGEDWEVAEAHQGARPDGRWELLIAPDRDGIFVEKTIFQTSFFFVFFFLGGYGYVILYLSLIWCVSIGCFESSTSTFWSSFFLRWKWQTGATFQQAFVRLEEFWGRIPKMIFWIYPLPRMPVIYIFRLGNLSQP